MLVKLLLIGDSGNGKTGALVSLIKAGYNLRILDYDNGADIIKNILRDEGKSELFDKHVNRQVVTDNFRIVGVNIIPTATAYNQGIKHIGNWPDNLGPITTWTDKDIFVLDSLTFAGKAATRFCLNLNGRIADLPGWNDYFAAQGMLEKLCGLLYSEAVKCHVIVISHVREVAKTHQELDSKGRPITVEEEGSRKGYAETGAGKALSPVIGRYFNSVLLVDIEGSGAGTRRIIRTVPHENIGLKNSAPGAVRPTYPIATGLAEYFAAVRGPINANLPQTGV